MAENPDIAAENPDVAHARAIARAALEAEKNGSNPPASAPSYATGCAHYNNMCELEAPCCGLCCSCRHRVVGLASQSRQRRGLPGDGVLVFQDTFVQGAVLFDDGFESVDLGVLLG